MPPTLPFASSCAFLSREAIVFRQLASSLVFCPNEKARAKILDESLFLSCQVAAGPRSADVITVRGFTVDSGRWIGHERVSSRENCWEFSALVCELLSLGDSSPLLKGVQVFNSQPSSQTRGIRWGRLLLYFVAQEPGIQQRKFTGLRLHNLQVVELWSLFSASVTLS